jgi:glycosyltransferase involved in cell wall biosynthesis
MKRVLIVGTVPSSAGVGGVTIHVERLLEYLDKQNIPYELYDYKKSSPLRIIGKIRKADVVHQHICNPYYMYFITLLSTLFQKKLITTFHGKYVEGEQKPWSIIKRSIKKCTVPIVLNDESYKTCISLNSNTIQIPAFIPPQKEEKLDMDIVKEVDDIHSHGQKAVVTYGYDAIYDVKGNEVYGIDFLINFFKGNNTYRLIVSDPLGSYSKKYRNEGAYFIDHPMPLYELVKIADIFVRNTSKDGDSLSVKEAVYLKKRTLCSDVVVRPQGVELFKYSDKESFEACLERNDKPEIISVTSGEERIVELYDSIIKNNS